MNMKNESDVLAMVESELSPVVTVPAPGGELTIAMSKRLPEAKRLEQAETILHGMIESAEAFLENPRPGVSNKLLTRPSQLAQGVSDVAKRLEYETRYRETLDLLKDTNRNSKRAADDAEIAAAKSTEAADNSKRAKTVIETHIIPRPSDYQVDQPTLSQWLANANVSITVRQIQRWEQYLKTDGKKGTKPPDGYTLQTRITTVSAEAWVSHYATQEKGKLTTRNFFNERTATRDRKPAKQEKTKEAT